MTLSATLQSAPDPHEEAIQAKLAAGDIPGAIAAAKDAVRADASNADRREALFNLLALVGDWPAAARQATTAGQLDPKRLGTATSAATAVACEQDRAAVWRGEATPTILGEPVAWVGKLVAATRQLHQGAVGAAAELAAEARAEANEQTDDAARAGTVTADQPGADEPATRRFNNWSDADDRLGPIWEMFVDGRYSWVPPGRIAEVRTEPPASLRNLIWQPAIVRWATGGTSGVLLPVRYFGTEATGDASLLRARSTDYEQPASDFYVGRGQRIWLTAGDNGTEEWPLLQVRHVRFDLADQLDDEPDDGDTSEGKAEHE